MRVLITVNFTQRHLGESRQNPELNSHTSKVCGFCLFIMNKQIKNRYGP